MPTAGPIARSVADLAAVMRVFWAHGRNKMFEQDPFVVPMPFSESSLKDQRPLRIGYYVHDGWFDASPSYARAVEMAADELVARGHVVVPFTVPDPHEFPAVMYGILSADGEMHGIVAGLEVCVCACVCVCVCVLALLCPFCSCILETDRVFLHNTFVFTQGEALHPDYEQLYKLTRIPEWLRALIAGALEFMGEHRLALVMRNGGGKTAREYWEYLKRLQR